MKLPRRNFLHLAAGAATLSAISRVARAQTYPTRPVRIVVGFPAGGGSDIVARLIGQWLSERLGQPFIVENRPGAATNIAAEAVVKSAPDGYTLLLFGSSSTINATLYDKLPFNLVRDIAPVAGTNRVPYVMEVNPSVPAKSVPEFIAYAKANPGKINMASAGNGSVQHVSGELFKMMTGVDMLHVPYRGDGLAQIAKRFQRRAPIVSQECPKRGRKSWKGASGALFHDARLLASSLEATHSPACPMSSANGINR